MAEAEGHLISAPQAGKNLSPISPYRRGKQTGIILFNTINYSFAHISKAVFLRRHIEFTKN